MSAPRRAAPAMAGIAVQNIVWFVAMGVPLFAAAGTLAWVQGWIFLVLFVGCSFALGLWLRRTNPALLQERRRSAFAAGQAPRDRALAAALLVALLAWLIFVPLDARRFGWSHVPAWGQAVGALLLAVAFAGRFQVLRANSFAVSTVRVQAERAQTVISTGPYAIVRHPMYAWTLLQLAGASLLLGSLWGLLGIAVAMPLLGARAQGEEAVLMDGLPGYPEYAARVRFRLLPGVW